MPENRVLHVIAARQASSGPLKATYVLATDPGQQRSGTVEEVQSIAEVQEEQGHSVRMRVAVNEADLAAPYPGAAVMARVHCGRRPVGYVWLHEVWEFIQLRLLF